MKKKRKSKKKWVQGALHKKRKGALHRALGVAEGKSIPLVKLEEASHRAGRIGSQARFALIARNFRHGK